MSKNEKLGKLSGKEDNIGLLQEDSPYYLGFSRIPSKPKNIYYKGDVGLLASSIKIAVVGPRKMSKYAEKVLRVFFDAMVVYQKAGKEIIIVSGGAEGVDEYAHMLAIEHKFSTICVLGGGISYYERGSKRILVGKILSAGGLLLTEYEDKFQPTRYSFPQRNRIIAGISQLVFLPEAGEKSGALLTVGYANEMGIPVVAPMQDIFNVRSAGSNRGIVDGSILPMVDFSSMLAKYFGPVEGLFTGESSNKNEVESCGWKGIMSCNNIEKGDSIPVQQVLIEEMMKKLGR